MPTYSYQCKRCDHVHDVFHGMTASPRIKCDVCGGPCKRLLGSGAGIIFKGSGFYETDYKKKGKAPAKEGVKEKSASSASETKPAESKSSGEAKTTPTAKAS